MPSIAVIGATGMLGRPVAQALLNNHRLSAGPSVRIIARDVAHARSLFPGAEVVAGDMRDPHSLRRALQGIGTVYLNLSVRQTEKLTDFHTETDGLQCLIEVARSVGVQRLAYLSSLVMRYQGSNGFRWWVFDVKQEAVRFLKTSGLTYSIFYPSCFIETLLHTQRLGPVILLVGQSAERLWFVAGADYGRQVVQALQRAQAGINQEYVIQGPEALTQQQAAQRLVRAYKSGRLRVLTVPSALLRLVSFFSAQADYGWHITHALNHYPECFEADRTWTELGKPELTIERFATT